MCSQCPQYATEAEADALLARLKGELNELCDLLQKNLEQLEASYRHGGLLYHSTEWIARHPVEIPEDSLRGLREAFEINSVEQYEAILAKVRAQVQKISELRAEVALAKVTGTIDERIHCFNHTFKTSVEQLVHNQDNEQARFGKLVDDVSLLFEFSKVYTVRANGPSSSWCRPVPAGHDLLFPLRQGSEWWMFTQWVSCLPETQRALQVHLATNRGLLHIALEVLYSQVEETLPEQTTYHE